MLKSKKWYLLLFLLASFVLMGSKCGRNTKPAPETAITPPPEIVKSTETFEEAPIRDKEYRSAEEVKVINFDYDRFDVSPDARKILQDNAGFLKKHPEYEILVEGHCCECGTNEYNLGLGQKRAAAVRDYYVKLGVTSDSIGTISYGKEKPININAGPPDSPACRSNRRAETKIRLKLK